MKGPALQSHTEGQRQLENDGTARDGLEEQMPATQSPAQSSDLCGTSCGLLTSPDTHAPVPKAGAIRPRGSARTPLTFYDVAPRPLPLSAKPGDSEQGEQRLTSAAAWGRFSE